VAKVKRQPKPKQPKVKTLRAPRVAKPRLVFYQCPMCGWDIERSKFPGHVDEHELSRHDEADQLADERRGV